MDDVLRERGDAGAFVLGIFEVGVDGGGLVGCVVGK